MCIMLIVIDFILTLINNELIQCQKKYSLKQRYNVNNVLR